MRVQIHNIDESYRLVFETENDNEQLLLDLLTELKNTPFSEQEDGVIAVLPNKVQHILSLANEAKVQNIVNQVITHRNGRKKRVLSAKGKAAISRAQKARWAAFKELGRTPLKPTKSKKVLHWTQRPENRKKVQSHMNKMRKAA